MRGEPGRELEITGEGLIETVEVRWFGRGDPPPEIVAWYREEVPHAEEPLARVDYYLWQAGGAGLGVKLREGRLELKRRVDNQDSIRFAPGVVGRVERWRKWSFALAADAAATEQTTGTGEWVAVAKDRSLGRFTLENSQGPVAVELAPEAFSACDCELTSVTMEPAGRWWTLAFEAFAAVGDPLDVLQAVAGSLLKRNRVLRLPAEQSQGYAEWLTRALTHASP